jgi:hypothetical protein
MPTFFEEIIGNGFMSVVGDQTIIGLLLLAFFGGFLLLQDTRLDVKVMIMVPVLLLTMTYISFFNVVVALILSVLAYLALMKVINH